MNKNISKQNLRQVLSKVKHPAIDHTLIELGILKSITIKNGKAELVLAFPFLGIPIKDILINSVQEPIEKMGIEVEVKTTVMNQKELQKFLTMEQEAWKG